MKLSEKLLEIRKAIPYMKKDAKGQNCTYAKGVDILAVIKPKMDELKVTLTPSILTRDLQTLDSGTDKSDNPKYTYMVSGDMQFIWEDIETGEQKPISWQYFGKNTGDPAQAFGSAMTYAERYFLLKSFQIETDKDDPDAYQKKKDEKKPISDEEYAALYDWVNAAGTNEAHVCKYLQISSFNDLTRAQYNWAINTLKEKAGNK